MDLLGTNLVVADENRTDKTIFLAVPPSPATCKLFGKNAELLIDHAWGWEPYTVEAARAYKPESNSLGSGQVLHQPYEADNARLVFREMAEILSMDLVDKGFVTDQLLPCCK